MKKVRIFSISLILAAAGMSVSAEHLILLHTNDTHSQIEPEASGAGGILQRKAVMDSVRSVEKNVIAIDAGDAVQGSLYFKLFGGDADYPLMNDVGYDIRILGNHEFDNGLGQLAKYWKKVKADRLSANYDFSGTPAAGLFSPYVIKKVGGKKVAFIGVNVDPESLIVADNYKGMKYKPAIAVADSLASRLKKEKKADLVVVVSHIGYDMGPSKEDDLKMAAQSSDIDIIIGGHSHTLVNPADSVSTPHIIKNRVGKPVLVTQTGKAGRYVGKIDIDLNRIGNSTPEYSLIPVTDRFPGGKLDWEMLELLSPYRAKVDSINSMKVGFVAEPMSGRERTGRFPNWTADFGSWYGNLILDSLRNSSPTTPRLDLAIMNVGGIRSSWAAGELNKGEVLSTFPFANRFVIMRIKGESLLKALQVAARKGGEAVSREVRVVMNPQGEVKNAIVSNLPLDPEKTYTVATIDYLAWGNDDLRSLADGEVFFTDTQEVASPLLRYLKMLRDYGLPVDSDPTPRFTVEIP